MRQLNEDPRPLSIGDNSKQSEELKKELEITQGSLMDLITQMSGSLEDEHHEDNSQPKISSEGGDSNDGNAIRNVRLRKYLISLKIKSENA
mgnify:CR=1 FL=1